MLSGETARTCFSILKSPHSLGEGAAVDGLTVLLSHFLVEQQGCTRSRTSTNLLSNTLPTP
jgi:hypothetical protein